MSGSELWTAPALEGAGFSPAVSELWAQWAITWPVWARAHDETGSPLYGTERAGRPTVVHAIRHATPERDRGPAAAFALGMLGRWSGDDVVQKTIREIAGSAFWLAQAHPRRGTNTAARGAFDWVERAQARLEQMLLSGAGVDAHAHESNGHWIATNHARDLRVGARVEWAHTAFASLHLSSGSLLEHDTGTLAQRLARAARAVCEAHADSGAASRVLCEVLLRDGAPALSLDAKDRDEGRTHAAADAFTKSEPDGFDPEPWIAAGFCSRSVERDRPRALAHGNDETARVGWALRARINGTNTRKMRSNHG